MKESNNKFQTNILSILKEKFTFNVSHRNLNYVLIGDSNEDKTFFLNAYFRNQCIDPYSTLGLSKRAQFIKVLNEKYLLTIWNPFGNERFGILPRKYYQNADGLLFLFDVTDPYSFYKIQS